MQNINTIKSMHSIVDFSLFVSSVENTIIFVATFDYKFKFSCEF